MRKWFGLLCACLMILTGCQVQTKPTLHLFYYETCPSCAKMEEEVFLPAQTQYGEQLAYEMHDLDQEESRQLYASFMGTSEHEGALADVPPEDREDYFAPLLVLEDYYAVMGYSSYLKDDYLADIGRALNKEALSSSLQDGRWYFRKDE